MKLKTTRKGFKFSHTIQTSYLLIPLESTLPSQNIFISTNLNTGNVFPFDRNRRLGFGLSKLQHSNFKLFKLTLQKVCISIEKNNLIILIDKWKKSEYNKGRGLLHGSRMAKVHEIYEEGKMFENQKRRA